MMIGTGLVVIGGVTLNPIILGSISGCGVLIQALAKLKSYDKKKTESCRVAYTNYSKLLVSIREHMRIVNLDDEVDLLKKMTIMNNN